MTEIKIPFTKNKVEKIKQSELEPGNKGLQIETQFSYPLKTRNLKIEKIAFIFKDNAESAIYNSLLSEGNQNFELNFTEEKVFLNIYEYHANIEIDKTKPEVKIIVGESFPNKKENKIVIFLEPKFTGIIKLTASGQQGPGPSEPPRENDHPTKDEDQKILQLETRIAELEEKLRNQPNSPSRQSDQDEIDRLKRELRDIKSNSRQPKKDEFPYLLVFGGGGANSSFISSRFIFPGSAFSFAAR